MARSSLTFEDRMKRILYLSLCFLIYGISFANGAQLTDEQKLAKEIMEFANKYKEEMKVYHASGGVLPSANNVETYYYQMKDMCELLDRTATIAPDDESTRTDDFDRLLFLERRLTHIAIAATSVQAKTKETKEIDLITKDYMTVWVRFREYSMKLVKELEGQDS